MEFSKNQLVNLTITDISDTGEGIGHIDGYTLFVKDAYLGDYCQVKITKTKKSYGFARLENIIEPSINRCEPPCENHRRCGGCQIQALSYDAQLKFKQDKVYGNLKRIGGFDDELLNSVFEEIIGMDNPYRYRNKAQYPVGYDKNGNIVAGFYAGRTHDIIPCSDCVIGIRENQRIVSTIIEHMNRYKVAAYNEQTGSGLIRHILIRKGFMTGQIMVCLVIAKNGVRGNYIPHQEDLCDALSVIEGMHSISVSINMEKTNVIMGDKIYTLWGSDTITDILLGKEYRISPLAFYQVNHEQCEKLYRTAADYAQLKKDDEVWDICCGIGTIAMSLADKVRLVHGIEIVPQAINDAKYNAAVNKVNNVDFFCEDATKYLTENADKMHADVIVMDPPRKGMTEEALDAVIKVSPERIVYVSCDPATLARDLKHLCENGYELKRVRPVDLFPHSVHCESVCLLVNPKARHHINVGIDSDEYYKIKNS